MELKKFIFGEPIPDKNDPKYKERYEREVAAGRKFAEKTGLVKVGAWIQERGNAHKKLFLVIVFGIAIISLLFNICSMVVIYKSTTLDNHGTAVEQVDKALQNRLHK